MNIKTQISLAAFVAWGMTLNAQLVTAVPGPSDQGGMVMPMVTITATSGPAANPTAGTINVNFAPPAGGVVLRPHEQWQPGTWFDTAAAWRPSIGSPAGVGGTPGPNAGAGDLYNNQYGFMFMANPMMGMANVPAGNSLGLRLTGLSSPSMEAFNYINSTNTWDQVWTGGVGSQVLWNGTMWHNYFTMPAGTPAGTYNADFEVFMADTAFTGSTGFAQYDAAALAAPQNANFTPATISYTFTVIPEPGAVTGLALLAAGIVLRVLRKRARAC